MSNKIIGIARNYNNLQNSIPKKYPIFFTKPMNSIVLHGNPIKIEKEIEFNYELELGVMIGKKCSNISRNDYLDYIGGYFLTLDLTEKSTIPLIAKNQGTWTVSKGYDYSTPVGEFINKELIPDPNNVILELLQNGKRVQLGCPKDLIYNISEQISILSHTLTLHPGDLILTGTYDNIGGIRIGDTLEGLLYLNKGKTEKNRIDLNSKIDLNNADFSIKFNVEILEKDKLKSELNGKF